MPLFSIIIAVYNDWTALDPCLRSLTRQTGSAEFEVIVVDDGSDTVAPEAIVRWAGSLPLTLIRQPHAGISAARNHGIQRSNGSILLFVDADCRVQPDSLAPLAAAVANSPGHNCFQLCLAGDRSTLVGRTEHLRLKTLQHQTLQPNGCVRYLNTAGFAIRRSAVPLDGVLFDPVALRAEDTLLLSQLIERDELPFFAGDATVQHEVPRSLLKCFRKDIRAAFLEGPTYAMIAKRGIRVRMSLGERWKMLRAMWRDSKSPDIGRPAFFALIARHLLSRVTSIGYRLFPRRSSSGKTNIAALKVNQ